MKLSTFDTPIGDAPADDNALHWYDSLVRLAGRVRTNFAAEAAQRALGRELAEMDPLLLRDIGVTDEDIHRLRAPRPIMPCTWM